MSEFELLKKIKSPADVKKLNINELADLCEEIRAGIINRVSKTGGHLGPNLGIAEVATALHYVFDSPKDKIVWDVSHQCYPHKMLTGRAYGFIDDKRFGEVSGYTAPKESEHDIFTVGHTSTSVSLACGLAKARDYKGGKENVIAVIGDGSLSGGEAFEGLDNAAELESNFIVIVNDNQMSIAENHGGIYGNLAVLRATKGTAKNNVFSALGFDYHYVENGNDVAVLIEKFKEVKDTDRPTLIHVHTLKGKGYAPAEADKETYHWSVPFDVETGKAKTVLNAETYGSIIAEYLDKKVTEDKNIVVVNAATPGALCLKDFRQKHPERYLDVGIAEEHAVAMTAAMTKGGMRPVALFFGGFLQRAYDQIIQEMCLDSHPAVMIVEGAGISGADVTHTAVQDIPMLANIPNLICLAPSSKDELLRMLDWALTQTENPVVIRTPGGLPVSLAYPTEKAIEKNKFEMTHKGSRFAILGLGNFLKLAEDVAAAFGKEGYDPTIINPRFISGLDEEMLNSLMEDHDTIITLEDGIVSGGFGEKIARFYGAKPVRVFTFGAEKEFTDRVPAEKLYERYLLNAEQIVKKILG